MMKGICSIIFLALLMGCHGMTPEKTRHQGKLLPAFKLLLSDSLSYNTGNIQEGKPSVLFYFRPNCPYSKAQMAEIIDNIDRVKDIQFYIFTSMPFADMIQFSKQYNLNKYKNITVGVDESNYFPHYFEVPGVPTIAIYSKEKKLNALFVGQTPLEQIKRLAK
ncbi:MULTISPECIES: TlpA family protein disulfide reductase [Niastella]|uniref:Thioredoxin family protein n=1 Tax=Niastella soli TaxID=2821487 RepID=A0ABS3YZE6_9BACT|nr:thioredoxin family protein [Niastella soli]MBO9203280.1 thioredoxin family protein [Niastella soli]